MKNTSVSSVGSSTTSEKVMKDGIAPAKWADVRRIGTAQTVVQTKDDFEKMD